MPAHSWLLRFAYALTRVFTRRKSRSRFRWNKLDRLFDLRLQLESLEGRTVPAAFTVSTTADSGAGSLRQAILDANATAGADSISFSIGSGAQTIAPASALPTITEAVTIDATTQPGWTSAPIIELRGDSAGAGVSGFTITSASSTIRGFVINRFTADGVTISGAGATGNVLAGNYIGTNATGTAAQGNTGSGVRIGGGASGNTVGGTIAGAGNVIDGSTHSGVAIYDSDGNTVAGNTIGLNTGGTAALPNLYGVLISNGSNNTVGGTTPGARNVISGNTNEGVIIAEPAATGNAVQGNYIGTDPTGTAALGNNRGVYI